MIPSERLSQVKEPKSNENINLLNLKNNCFFFFFLETEKEKKEIILRNGYLIFVFPENTAGKGHHGV